MNLQDEINKAKELVIQLEDKQAKAKKKAQTIKVY